MGSSFLLLLALSASALAAVAQARGEEETEQCRYEFVVPKKGGSCVGVAGGVATLSPAQLLQKLTEDLASWRAEHEAEVEKLGTRLDSVAKATEGYNEHVDVIGDRVLAVESATKPSSGRSRRSVSRVTLGEVEAELSDALASVTKDLDALTSTLIDSSQSVTAAKRTMNLHIGQNAAMAARLRQQVADLEQQLASWQPVSSGFHPGVSAPGNLGSSHIDVTQVTQQLSSLTSQMHTKKQAREKRFHDLDANVTSLITATSAHDVRIRQHLATYEASLTNISGWSPRLQSLDKGIQFVDTRTSSKIVVVNRTSQVVKRRMPRLQRDMGQLSVGVMNAYTRSFAERQQRADLQRDLASLLRNVSDANTLLAVHSQKLTSLSRAVASIGPRPASPATPYPSPPAPYPTPSIINHRVPTPAG